MSKAHSFSGVAKYWAPVMIVSQYSLRPIVVMAEAVSIIMYATIELAASKGHRSGKARQQGVE